MIYRVRHSTRYRYDYAVAASQHAVRLLPVDRPGLEVFSANLLIEPEPGERHERTDFFGNRTVAIAFDVPHRSLELTMRARVKADAGARADPGETPAWEQVADAAIRSADLSPKSPVHGLGASRNVAVVGDITEYAAKSFAAAVPVLAGAMELTHRIRADFRYEAGATDVSTSPAEAFRLRRGVCQDFAQVLIAGLRGLGLPALYVSGFLRTVPPPGRARLEGADATHAWVLAWCGDAAGWVGLDPTNDILAGEDHITLAIGRDYADVAPVDGVIVSAGDHALEVEVDVVPEDDGTATG